VITGRSATSHACPVIDRLAARLQATRPWSLPILAWPGPARAQKILKIRLQHTEFVPPGVPHDPEIVSALLLVVPAFRAQSFEAPYLGVDIAGRPSKALTLDQARDVLTYTKKDSLYCYIVMSLLTGARTEELRALRWENVHLESDPKAVPRVVPYVEVWRSVRSTGDTKMRKSRRTLALPALVVDELVKHRARQAQIRLRAEFWQDDDLVFPTARGTEMHAANVRRDFRRALKSVPNINPDDWTPREMRHSFVSLLSESGIPLEEISRLVGHKGGSQVTELVYRKQLRPVIETGAR
jgi:integrase